MISKVGAEFLLRLSQYQQKVIQHIEALPSS
jgi:hypothetical protein